MLHARRLPMFLMLMYEPLILLIFKLQICKTRWSKAPGGFARWGAARLSGLSCLPYCLTCIASSMLILVLLCMLICTDGNNPPAATWAACHIPNQALIGEYWTAFGLHL